VPPPSKSTSSKQMETVPLKRQKNLPDYTASQIHSVGRGNLRSNLIIPYVIVTSKTGSQNDG
jgi:hypothetical protein